MLKLRSIPIAVLVVFAAWLLASCSDTTDFLVEKTHPEGWSSPSSETFHGKFVLESAEPSESCQSCHGQNYKGGTSGVACTTCHAAYPHPEGFANPSSGDFHEVVFQDTRDWDLTTCQECHGGDYARDIISLQFDEPPINCLDCHAGDDGPEGCLVCHGSSGGVAPPQDLLDNTSTAAVGVGAHQEHLNARIATAVQCAECHVIPDDYADPGHVLQDGTPGRAEVVFSGIATRQDNEPAYDFATSTCGNSYCHGSFVFARENAGDFAWGYTGDFMRGNNADVVWNAVGSGEAECGTCHGLPPEGHIEVVFVCSTCHVGVTDQQNNILDPTLHMNGEKDLFEFPSSTVQRWLDSLQPGE